MKKILVPCDGSDNALRAVRHAAEMARLIPGSEIELLYVHDPVMVREHATLSCKDSEDAKAAEAERILAPARPLLEAQGVSCRTSTRCGPPASEIALHARESHCDGIMMGTRGLGPIASVMIGSVASRVIHLVDVPVTLIK